MFGRGLLLGFQGASKGISDMFQRSFKTYQGFSGDLRRVSKEFIWDSVEFEEISGFFQKSFMALPEVSGGLRGAFKAFGGDSGGSREFQVNLEVVTGG